MRTSSGLKKSTIVATTGRQSFSVALGGALVTVSRIINQLQEFLSEVGDVDEEVKTFFNSVKNLGTVLKALQNAAVKDHPILSDNFDFNRVLDSVENLVSDCQHTTSNLEMILRKLGKKGLIEYRTTLELLQVENGANEILRIRWHIGIYRESFQTFLIAILITTVIVNQTTPPSDKFFKELRSRQQLFGGHIKNLSNFQRPEEQPSKGLLENENDQQILEDVESFRRAVESVYNTTHDLLNHWSPKEPSSPLTPVKYQEIRGWIEKLSEGNSSEEEPQVEEASAVRISRIIPETTGARSKFVEHELSHIKLVKGETVLSEYEMTLRTTLIEQGTDEYGLGHYTNAYDCFQEAYRLGSIGTSPSNVTSDKRLMIWLSLSALRKQNLNRLNRRPGDYATKKAASLWKEVVAESFLSGSDNVTEEESQDACLLAESLIFAGELDKAEAYCKFALRIGMTPEEQAIPGIKRPILPGTMIRRLCSRGLHEPTTAEAKNDLYHNALLTMVHLLYAKGPSEIAKEFRARVSAKRLEAIAKSFFSQIPTIKPKDKLLEAIRGGNFYAVLFTVKEPLDQGLHMKEKGSFYLYNASIRDSIAILALLIEEGANLEDGPEGLEIAKTITPIYRAIECHNSKAAEILVQAGANTKHKLSLQVDTSFYCDVYPGIRFVSTPLGRAVAEGLKEVAEFLMDHGTALDDNSDSSLSIEPVLFTAIRFQAGRRLIPFLLERGVDVNQVFGGMHPLTCVIMCDQVKLSPSAKSSKSIEADAYPKTSRETIVRWLIGAGANVNVSYSKNGDPKNQRSIIDFARKKGLKGIERVLNLAGAKNATSCRRHT